MSVDAQLSCSRERSRQARAVLNEFFYVVTDGARYELDDRCPIARQKDMFYEQEKHKERVRYSKQYWRSLYSGKVFKSEYYVDKHMERRHRDKIPPGADICLAEYCDLLQCDRHVAYSNDEKHKSLKCDKPYLVGVRAACKDLLAQCFSDKDTSDKAERLNAYFTKYYCDRMTCEDVDGVFTQMSAHHEKPSVSYYVLLGFILLFLTGYYASVYSSWSSGRHVSSDLRRTRSLARAKSLMDYLPRRVTKRLLRARKKQY